MSVNVIDTIKPKNGGSFPVVEAADVSVGAQRLPAALAEKAGTADLAALEAEIGDKASSADILQLRNEIALKAPQSSLDATNVIVASKAAQSSLDALSVVVERKADKRDYDNIYAEIDKKADRTTVNTDVTSLNQRITQVDNNLQNQIDQIEISASSEAIVAPEVAAARVGTDGESYETLKLRLDTENEDIYSTIENSEEKTGSILRSIMGTLTITPVWSHKTVREDGSQDTTEESDRMSNNTLIGIPKGCKAVITLLPGYYSMIYKFDNNQEFIERESTLEVDGDEAAYIRILVGSSVAIDLSQADQICKIEISAKVQSEYIAEPTWSHKTVKPDGSQDTAEELNRMSNNELINIPRGCKAVISLASGYIALAYEFDSTQTFVQNTRAREIDGDEVSYIRVLVGSESEIDLTEADSIIQVEISPKIHNEFDELRTTIEEVSESEKETSSIVHAMVGDLTVSPIWSNRSVREDGSQGTIDSNRMSNNNLINVPKGCKAIVTVAAGYISLVYEFDSTQTFIQREATTEVDGDEVSYFRVLVGSDNDIDVSQGDQICHIDIVFKSKRITSPYNIFSEIVKASSAKKVVLLGDSITQGTGSTGFVSYNKVIDGISYSVRGNGPDYPYADENYQVGDFIYRHDNRIWYEAIDGHGWAQLFKDYLESKFNCTVKNYGCSGANANNLYGAVQESVIGQGFDIAIVTIGTNNRQDTNLNAYYSDLIKIINALRSDNVEVVVVGNIPASVSNESQFNFHMEDINHMAMKCAADCEVPFVSLYSDFIDYCEYTGNTIDGYLGDGLHPNDNGYAVMYKLICKETGIVPKRPDATW